MRVFILDNAGNKVEIDPKNLEVGNRTLISWLDELSRVNREFLEFKSNMEKRELELHKMWGKIK